MFAHQFTTLLSLERLNYVNIPLLVSYQPVSALKLMAGLNLAIRLNKFNAFGEGTNNLDSELLSSEGRTSESVDLIFDQGIKRTDISGVIGVGYFPLKNTGIDLRYNYGFQDYSRNEIFQNGKRHINQNLQLSLVHYFGK